MPKKEKPYRNLTDEYINRAVAKAQSPDTSPKSAGNEIWLGPWSDYPELDMRPGSQRGPLADW